MRVMLTSVLIVGVVTMSCAIWALQEKAICAINSPDERYVLTVFKRNIDSFPVMPGHGSDVRCIVELRRRGNGQLILRKDVDMLQNVDHIQWDADRVWINPHSAISYEGKLPLAKVNVALQR